MIWRRRFEIGSLANQIKWQVRFPLRNVSEEKIKLFEIHWKRHTKCKAVATNRTGDGAYDWSKAYLADQCRQLAAASNRQRGNRQCLSICLFFNKQHRERFQFSFGKLLVVSETFQRLTNIKKSCKWAHHPDSGFKRRTRLPITHNLWNQNGI